MESTKNPAASSFFFFFFGWLNFTHTQVCCLSGCFGLAVKLGVSFGLSQMGGRTFGQSFKGPKERHDSMGKEGLAMKRGHPDCCSWEIELRKRVLRLWKGG